METNSVCFYSRSVNLLERRKVLYFVLWYTKFTFKGIENINAHSFWLALKWLASMNLQSFIFSLSLYFSMRLTSYNQREEKSHSLAHYLSIVKCVARAYSDFVRYVHTNRILWFLERKGNGKPKGGNRNETCSLSLTLFGYIIIIIITILYLIYPNECKRDS